MEFGRSTSLTVPTKCGSGEAAELVQALAGDYKSTALGLRTTGCRYEDVTPAVSRVCGDAFASGSSSCSVPVSSLPSKAALCARFSTVGLTVRTRCIPGRRFGGLSAR